MNICVYCSSSDAAAAPYFQAARELGVLLVEHGHTLVYGGTDVGLMGALAHTVHDHGGHTIGVFPGFFNRGLAYNLADEMVITGDMRERKAAMEARADAFVALPGGFGTLEELMEILTLKELHQHNKAVALIDTNGFYGPLVELFEHFYRERLAKEAFRQLYFVAPDPAAALSYIESYRPIELPGKWF